MKRYYTPQQIRLALLSGKVVSSKECDSKQMAYAKLSLSKQGVKIERERLHPDGTRFQEHIYRMTQ